MRIPRGSHALRSLGGYEPQPGSSIARCHFTTYDPRLLCCNTGDICAIAGLRDVKIGETITHPDAPNPLPTITVEEPTVTMSFMVNTSPFAGREGKFVTTRNIKERLERELERNLALKVELGVLLLLAKL